ncbi:MAG: putative glycosyl hydrolase [Capsulimonas sp.]|nr:putative glycosyl hydrolase [Capsulimonas sp.]
MGSEPKPTRISRRKFLNQVVGAGLVVGTTPFLPSGTIPAKAAGADPAQALPLKTPASGPMPPLPAENGWRGPMGIERIARLAPLGHQSPQAVSDDTVQWVQVDLGAPTLLDHIKLFPMIDFGLGSQNYPVRFRVEASADPNIASPIILADCTGADFPEPGDAVSHFPADKAKARYVRITVTRLRDRKFQLSKLEVWSGGKDVAEGCPVSDSVHGDLGRTPLTRVPRGQGEDVSTDNPGNIIPARQWRPVSYKAQAPIGGVRLGDGVLKTAMQDNIDYLLASNSVDELVRPFRERAGMPIPAGLKPPIEFWDTDLPGSNAGRFLMGAGNTLRWMEHPELRARMNAIVDGIVECQRADGYLMAYPEESIFYSERGAYTRSWVTHGLIEAGLAGHPKAFPALRRFYDWFDTCPYLPELLRRAGQGVQGMIANTRTYFTPIGKPEDLQVVQRFFQENYWMEQLAQRDPKAIWQYPYDHPHNYLITSLEPYLDQYRATGATKYWDAAKGGWDLYRDNWLHVGGSIAICEFSSYPPHSYYLHKQTGELCGSVFWARYNQRFHLLAPSEEKYVAEIEKSIYNNGLANQAGSKGIRYLSHLTGHKDTVTSHNTCCEGQGTRLLGSLPEYIYSTAKDGLYVNLFHASSIEWAQGSQNLKLAMETEFPFKPEVKLTLDTSNSVKSSIRVRIPTWASKPMPIHVNGKRAATGKPGTYVALDRAWKSGDVIEFTLPMEFQQTRYAGMDPGFGQERFALEYGPILMALVGKTGGGKGERLNLNSDDLAASLSPIPDQPLHFAVAGHTNHHYRPYWQVQEEEFTCYPVIGTSDSTTTEPAEAGNLALASLGAKAASDSEYANEPGGTARIIDDHFVSAGQEAHRWHSSLDTPHPHWIEVTLPQATKIGRVVIRFADPEGHPVDFDGIVRVNGKDKTIFQESNYADPLHYRATFKPITTDTFRLVIRASANPAFPNAAQISRIELYPPG